MQPSSASVERFFATVKANTSAQQNAEPHETHVSRYMSLEPLQHLKRKETAKCCLLGGSLAGFGACQKRCFRGAFSSLLKDFAITVSRVSSFPTRPVDSSFLIFYQGASHTKTCSDTILEDTTFWVGCFNTTSNNSRRSRASTKATATTKEACRFLGSFPRARIQVRRVSVEGKKKRG
jgi:hypothetical protein